MRRREQKTSSSGGATVTRQILTSVAMAALFAAVGLFHVASKVAAVNAGYELGQAEALHRTLERENVSLKLQVATLRSAAHIETTARTELGMTAPAAQGVFRIGGPITPLTAPAQARPAVHARPASKPMGGGTPLALLSREER